MTTWIFLALAISAEVAGTTCMKLSAGFTRWQPSVLIFVFYGLAFIFLSLCLKRLEIGFAYAVWSGIGTLLIFLIGVYSFNEPITLVKTLSLFCIIIGVIGLKQA